MTTGPVCPELLRHQCLGGRFVITVSYPSCQTVLLPQAEGGVGQTRLRQGRDAQHQ